MSVAERLLLRNKIVGALVRDARVGAGLTQKECGAVLGVSAGVFSDLESGDRPLSLPELEAFARLVRLPVEHFFGEELLERAESDIAPAGEVLALRDRVIGVLLRQARLARGMSQADCGRLVSATEDRITAYELGQSAIPLAELEILSGALGVRLEDFVDSEHNPLVASRGEAQASEELSHLPGELRAFVADPLNSDYIRTALRLSGMPAEQLRTIAEALLELTY